MSSASPDCKALLTAFSGGLLALLTPMERAEFDGLTRPSFQQAVDSMPLHVRAAVLPAIIQWGGKRGTSKSDSSSTLAELDLPADLKQLDDAFSRGCWRGEWLPGTEDEFRELAAWLEAQHQRPDALPALVHLGSGETSPWNLLLMPRQGPRGSDAWAVAEAARELRARCDAGSGTA